MSSLQGVTRQKIMYTIERILLIAAIVFAIVAIVVPVLMAILWSLVSRDTPWSYPDMFPQKIGFDRWIDVWKFTSIKQSLINSYTLAPVVSLLVTLLALPVAYVLGRFEFRGKSLVEIIFYLPLMIPAILIAVFFAQTLNAFGFYNKFLGIVLGHSFINLPYGVHILTSAFSRVPQDQIDAARDLGASKWKVFFTAYFPLVRPALFASALFVFIRSIEEFNISYIIGAPNYVTVPTILFSFLDFNFVRPNAAVVSLMLLLPNVVAMMFIERALKADKNLGSGTKG